MNYLIFDTETTNGYMKEGRPCLDDSLVYDLGYAIANEKGDILLARSYVIAEIFLDKELMESAFFKDKIPSYWEDIKNGRRSLISFFRARKILREDMKKFDCVALSAHNSSFDIRALNNTTRLLTGSRARFFFPYSWEILDTLKMSRDSICSSSEYIDYCKKNGFLTKHRRPQVRATAEILYRYLSRNTDFIESHTGLEDVLIEKEILIECLKKLDSTS